MIKAVIIDDEERARKLLKEMIGQLLSGRLNVIAEADGVATGVEVITKHKPDMVFLDVQMHDGTGFDVLEKLKDLRSEIVFVTAYDQYAIQAIQFSAFGYLLKPIKPKALFEVIERFETNRRELIGGVDKRARVLIENYGDDGKIKKLIINHMNGFDVSLVKDIMRLEGDGNYTNFIITNNRRVITSRTIGEYEELLLNHGFYRIHQSTIANLRHITKYHKYQKGSGGQIEMTDGKLFNVSRYRKSGFMKNFLGE